MGTDLLSETDVTAGTNNGALLLTSKTLIVTGAALDRKTPSDT